MSFSGLFMFMIMSLMFMIMPFVIVVVSFFVFVGFMFMLSMCRSIAIATCQDVGENQFECRESVCKDMEFMGIKLDNNVNAKVRGEEAIISTADSKVKVVVIPTDEELLIASDTMDILKK